MGRRIGTVLSFFAIVFEIVSALVLTPFIIKSFGQAEYGVYTLSISITGYLVLLDLGVGNSVIRFMAKYKAQNDRDKQLNFVSIISCFYAIIAIVVVVIGIVIITVFPTAFAKGLSENEIVLAQKLLRITIFNMAVTLGTAGFYYTIISYEYFIVSKGIPILLGLLKIIISLVALKMGSRSITIVSINLLCTIITRLIMVLYVLLKMKLIPKIKSIDFSQIKEIIAYSSFIMIQMIATQLNNLTDHILIGALVKESAAILAVYGVGNQISTYFQSIGSSINSVIMPGVVKMVEDKSDSHRIEDEMIRIGRLNLIFLSIVWCVFLVFGKSFVELWSGKDNVNGYYVALFLMLPQVIILTETIGNQFLWALNKHKEQSIIKLIVVLINIILTVFLVQWKPLLGATVGTFISLLIGDILLMQYVFKKHLRIRLTSYYKKMLRGILPSILIATVSGYCFSLFKIRGLLGFSSGCAVMLLVYILSLLFFGLSEYERALFKRLLQKFHI